MPFDPFRSFSRLLVGFQRVPVILLLLSGAAWAVDEEQPASAPAATRAAPSAAGDIPTLRLNLQEGSVVSGNLSVASITVETDFGTLEVPVASIVSFTPGLNSHPEEKLRVGRLILQLGANASTDRDDAERKLLELGPKVRGLLENHAEDEDAERRTRIRKILAELDELAADGDFDAADLQPWIDDDTIVTTRFTVVGRISPREFKVETKFGGLDVALTDIRRAEREGIRKPDVRKTVQVSAASLALTSFLGTGIRVERGDRVELRADGTITMEPWGHEMKCTPEGGQQFGIFQPGIFNGTLVAKIGSNGQLFKVGSRYEATARQGGLLYLGIAMSADFANQGYTFPGQYSVKIRVQPK
ncbi:MAG TPA: hypothetical protein VML55_21865 [Planctomycetaceae bacterium]|nr:hypothetical protein [Planctomycetaceae bacterium]